MIRTDRGEIPIRVSGARGTPRAYPEMPMHRTREHTSTLWIRPTLLLLAVLGVTMASTAEQSPIDLSKLSYPAGAKVEAA